MGLFSITPKTKKETQVYEQEKARALKIYTTEKNKAQLESIKQQARFDALPRGERAKQRLSAGIGFVKNAGSKYAAFDAKMQARQAAQKKQTIEPQGGIIEQSMKRDQGEGLLIRSLRGKR